VIAALSTEHEVCRCQCQPVPELVPHCWCHDREQVRRIGAKTANRCRHLRRGVTRGERHGTGDGSVVAVVPYSKWYVVLAPLDRPWRSAPPRKLRLTSQGRWPPKFGADDASRARADADEPDPSTPQAAKTSSELYVLEAFASITSSLLSWVCAPASWFWSFVSCCSALSSVSDSDLVGPACLLLRRWRALTCLSPMTLVVRVCNESVRVVHLRHFSIVVACSTAISATLRQRSRAPDPP